MPSISIAIYRPEENNHYHWALHLHSARTQILEVTGAHPTFEPRIIDAESEAERARAERLVENIRVGEINDRDVSGFYATMRRVRVENEVGEWNGQDYVVEALEALTGEGILDGEDVDFRRGVRRAKMKYYGAQ